MSAERVVVVEESALGQYVKVVTCGNLDDSLLDAIEDYVKRQRKRAEAPRLFSTDDDQPLARSSGDDLREDAKLSPSASNKGENV
jgi:hypothetical protein